jgi:autotransporter family porin
MAMRKAVGVNPVGLRSRARLGPASLTFVVVLAACASSPPRSVTNTTATATTASKTLPPGAALPSDAECASRVAKSPEVRPANDGYNQTRGRQKNIGEKWLDRVTGDYTGTTDEILQWGACKWGIDADIVRAQAAKESYWNMSNLGDFGTDPAACPPDHGLGADGKAGQCPQSVGILQVRYPYHGPPAGRPTWPEAEQSTAYNVDYAYANWRSCYEGDVEWLNTTDRGATYAAGDAWGCVGVWFSGRWHTKPADDYIAAVHTYYDQHIWTTGSFINSR